MNTLRRGKRAVYFSVRSFGCALFIFGGMGVVDYEKMYHYLFNAITDAIEKIEELDFGTAKQKLTSAQQKTEEMYIEAEE